MISPGGEIPLRNWIVEHPDLFGVTDRFLPHRIAGARAGTGQLRHGSTLLLLITCIFTFGFYSSDVIGAQDPFDDPFDDPFNDASSLLETGEDLLPAVDSDASATIEVAHGGRIHISGPNNVPNLSLVATLRVEVDLHSETESSPQPPRFRGGDLRMEGSALEDNHYRFRLNLDGLDSPGLFSEAWLDRRISGLFHLSAGRIPNSFGLKAGLPREDRITFTSGVLDWLSEGSSWSLRTGGRWVEDAVISDLQARFGGAADPGGDYFGGSGISGRLSIEPFSPLLFGGPGAVDTPGSGFSMFLAGRIDHEAAGRIQVRSPGDTSLLNTQHLSARSVRWVQAGWRWPVRHWLHLENEWMRQGLHGVEKGNDRIDLPGEFTGWRFGIRTLLSETPALKSRYGPDLPPSSFDTPGQYDTEAVELLLEYERANLAEQLQDEGMLALGSASGTVQILKVGLGIRPRSWFRCLLEGAWISTEEAAGIYPTDEARSIRLMLEFGG